MKQYNLITSMILAKDIYDLQSETFIIINSQKMRNCDTKELVMYFNIKVTEEDATFLKLKLGEGKVWER